MPVNPSLRLCSTMCPPLGPLQENMHHLKPEPSTAIEKHMNQMPTLKSGAHWLTICSNFNKWDLVTLRKRRYSSEATTQTALALPGSSESKLILLLPSEVSSCGGLPNTPTPLLQQEIPLFFETTSAIWRTLRDTNDHFLLKLFVCMLFKNRHSGCSPLKP